MLCSVAILDYLSDSLITELEGAFWQFIFCLPWCAYGVLMFKKLVLQEEGHGPVWVRFAVLLICAFCFAPMGFLLVSWAIKILR